MIKGARRRSPSVKGIGRLLVFCVALLISTRAIFAQSFKVDAAVSEALTIYLRQHLLPLVGAQVLADGAGNRRIVLYGFVATKFGKNDAARRALSYVENGGQGGTTAPQVENRIEIRPEIARMKTHSAPVTAAAVGNESLDQVLDDIDRYGVSIAPAEPTPK